MMYNITHLSPVAGGGRAAIPGQLWVQAVRLLLPVQGLPTTFVFSFEFRRRGVADPTVELPPSSRSGVAAWGSGWEEDFLFFFFF